MRRSLLNLEEQLKSRAQELASFQSALSTLQDEHAALLGSQARDADALQSLQEASAAMNVSQDNITAQRDDLIAAQDMLKRNPDQVTLENERLREERQELQESVQHCANLKVRFFNVSGSSNVRQILWALRLRAVMNYLSQTLKFLSSAKY